MKLDNNKFFLNEDDNFVEIEDYKDPLNALSSAPVYQYAIYDRNGDFIDGGSNFEGSDPSQNNIEAYCGILVKELGYYSSIDTCMLEHEDTHIDSMPSLDDKLAAAESKVIQQKTNNTISKQNREER